MKSIEEFKSFVKNHPELVSYVNKNEMTWQKFYELYSLYDSDSNVWDKYLKKTEVTTNGTNTPSFSEIFNMLKNVKPEIIQQNITSIQKFLGFIAEFVGDKSNTKQNKYSSYPIKRTHKMFED